MMWRHVVFEREQIGGTVLVHVGDVREVGPVALVEEGHVSRAEHEEDELLGAPSRRLADRRGPCRPSPSRSAIGSRTDPAGAEYGSSFPLGSIELGGRALDPAVPRTASDVGASRDPPSSTGDVRAAVALVVARGRLPAIGNDVSRTVRRAPGPTRRRR
jgi:hypothetical protein